MASQLLVPLQLSGILLELNQVARDSKAHEATREMLIETVKIEYEEKIAAETFVRLLRANPLQFLTAAVTISGQSYFQQRREEQGVDRTKHKAESPR